MRCQTTKYQSIPDILRNYQLSNTMKLLPICFGHPQRTTGTFNFASFGRL